MVLVVIIPLATLFAMANALNRSNDPNVVPAGSPAWVALKGSSFVDTISGELATGFGAWSIGAGTTSPSSSTAVPSCAAYISALYDQYYAYSNKLVSSGAATNGVTDSAWNSAIGSQGGVQLKSASTTGLTTVSYLWQQAFLNNWIDAQYGSIQNGSSAACHQLESNAGITPGEQYALMVVAGKYDGRNYAYISPAVFATIGQSGNASKKSFEAQMLAWQACSISGGSGSATADGATHTVSNFSPSADPGWSQLTGIPSSDCAAWYNQSPGVSTQIGNDIQGIANAAVGWIPWVGSSLQSNCSGSTGLDAKGMPCALELSNSDAVSTAQNKTASGSAAWNDANTINAFWGHDPTQRLLDGIMALLIAAIYLFALGALAIGTVLAQLGLVLMLALLPVTLILLAIPTKEGGRIQSGVKLMKMTFGFFISKLALTMVLLLLIQSIALFEQLTAGMSSGGFSTILHAAIPLVCLFLVRKLLSAAGMGNLTSLSGAIGMPLAAGMAMTGDKALAGGMMSRFNKGADKLGLNKADKLAKTPWNKTKQFAGRRKDGALMALRSAKPQGMSRAAQRYRAVMGRRDADGKLVESGLVQRVGSLAGMLEVAKSGKLGGKLQSLAEGDKLQRVKAYAARSSKEREALTGLSQEVMMTQAQERRELLAVTAGTRGINRTEAVARFYQDRGESKLYWADGIVNSHGESVTRTSIIEGVTGAAAIYGFDPRQGGVVDPKGDHAKMDRAEERARVKVAGDAARAAATFASQAGTAGAVAAEAAAAQEYEKVYNATIESAQSWVGDDTNNVWVERAAATAARRASKAAKATIEARSAAVVEEGVAERLGAGLDEKGRKIAQDRFDDAKLKLDDQAQANERLADTLAGDLDDEVKERVRKALEAATRTKSRGKGRS